jgi:uncharacterized repeat protein (TIGR01451 family)
VAAGGTVTYTISVKNIGFVNANNVSVEDDLSSFTSFISCTASQGSCSYNSSTHDVLANLGTLTPGQTATLTIKAAAPTGSQCDGSFKNEVKAFADHEHDTSTNYAHTYTTCKKPDVEVKKTDSPDPVKEGGTITYTITVRNVSYVSASNVVVTDELPDHTDFISCTSAQGTCSYNSTTGVVTANVGTLTPAQSVVITLKVEAPWGWKCDGKIYNTAKVSASHDSNSSNNSATTYTYCKRW